MPRGDAAHAFRAVAGPGRDLLRLRRGLNHRDHDAHCAGIEHGCDQGVMAAGHAHHRHDPEPAGGGDCVLMVSMPTPLCSVSSKTKSAPASASIVIRPGEKNSKAI